jgi:hypothetical protein
MPNTTSKTKQEAALNVPYLNAYGNITRVLEKIKTASTPERFTQDFLSTKLGLASGSAKPLIPFLKRTGFLNGDGTPTDLYKKFRNQSASKIAAAEAVRTGYNALYEINVYIHEADDNKLKGAIVQVTGLDADSSTVRAMVSSFKALRSFADFEQKSEQEIDQNGSAEEFVEKELPIVKDNPEKPLNLKLGYTINLNLPATSDIAVFDAIFRSLRKNLLDE